MGGFASGTADILAIYEFLRHRLQEDHESFLRGLKKMIRVVCKTARESLTSSPEFAGSIPDASEDVIIQELLECIDKGRVFREENILPFDEIPKRVREAFTAEVLRHLNTSLEFYQRNYYAWSQQEIQGITQNLNHLGMDLEKLLKDNHSNSAKRFHEAPTNRSRFHYSNGNIEFKGLDVQLKQLHDFCQCDYRDRLDRDFSWWVVTGEGGSGKSRLCLEFSKQMTDAGWSVCAQQNYNIEKLWKCSQSIFNNTLFIIDYAEYDIGTIFRWIDSFHAEQFSHTKIRILLIQRRGSWKDIKETIHYEFVSDGFVEKSLFEEVFLHVEKLDQDILKNKALIGEIQMSYARNERKDNSLTTEDTDTLYELLQKVDRELLRPLYAIILVDAYLDNKDIPLTWRKGEVLDYICGREEALIRNTIKEDFAPDQCRKMSEIACTVCTIATMTNGLSYNSIREMLPEEERNALSQWDLEKLCENPVLFIKEANGELYCPPIEPDIIGEFFVLRCLNQLKRFDKTRAIINASWHKPYYMSRFVTKMLQDHEETIKSEYPELLNILKKVHLPKGLQRVEDNAFFNYSNLTEIILPESIKTIGEGAFSSCYRLTDITIPKSVTYIGNWAFMGCSSLTQVAIPEAITSIGEGAFSLCSGLIEITIPNSVKNISKWAFEGSTSLTKVTISESVIDIGTGAFLGCSNLYRIIIPESVISIRACAFSGCSSLTEIKIPKSVTSISVCAFVGCHSLKDVYIYGQVNDVVKEALIDFLPQLTVHESQFE